MTAYFLEKNHEYFDHIGKLQSASGVMSELHDKFNEIEISYYSSCKELFPNAVKETKKHVMWHDPNFVEVCTFGMSADQINLLHEHAERMRQSWIKDADYGTNIHLKEENLAIERGYEMLDGIRYKTVVKKKITNVDNYYILNYILDKYQENIYIPEAMVYDSYYRIAGQIDKLYLQYLGPGRWVWHNGDYKTDKKMNFSSIYKEKVLGGKRYPQLFYPPLNSFQDSNYWYYSLKMSIYGLLLSDLGIIPGKTFLIHIPKRGVHNIIPLNYYPEHAQLILDMKTGEPEVMYGKSIESPTFKL